MSRSCVCAGSNENCRFCGGTGTLPDLLGDALADSLQRLVLEPGARGTSKVRGRLVSHRVRARRSSSQINLIRCPEGCGAFLNPRKVARHLSKVHGRPSTPPQKQEDPIPVIGVPSKRLDSPAAVNRPKSASAPKVRANVRPVTENIETAARQLAKLRRARSSFEVCPVCKARLKATRLEKHLRKVHRKRVSRSPIVHSAKDPTRQATTLVAPRDKNLDATKLYAHPCREQGRFGSHPSHDGFDDESSPD